MDRRVFMALAASGLCTAAAPSCRQPQTPTPPPAPLATDGGVQDFDAWLTDFRARALAAGWPRALLDRELAGLTPNPQVIALDRRQPEISRPVGDYMRSAITEQRIQTGRGHRQSLAWLPAVEQRFGVPGEVLISIWAMETAFGTIQGDLDVIRSLASLAADGRRRAFAEAQLFAALRMIATGEATREQLKGSWAGAIGQTQFIPETFLSTAVDGDGDGKRDLWGSTQDALSSAANLLSKAGWRMGEGWAREVRLAPGFDYALAEGPRQPAVWWAERGARPADGGAWTAADAAAPAGLVLPAGAAGPAFLVLPNHFIIRRYNNSTSYALAVGLLADRIAGKGPLVASWPAETGLAAADRIGAQEALAKLGYNPGGADGIIGTNTRAALRAWQAAKGLPADGHLTQELAQRLIAEAAGR